MGNIKVLLLMVVCQLLDCVVVGMCVEQHERVCYGLKEFFDMPSPLRRQLNKIELSIEVGPGHDWSRCLVARNAAFSLLQDAYKLACLVGDYLEAQPLGMVNRVTNDIVKNNLVRCASWLYVDGPRSLRAALLHSRMQGLLTDREVGILAARINADLAQERIQALLREKWIEFGFGADHDPYVPLCVHDPEPAPVMAIEIEGASPEAQAILPPEHGYKGGDAGREADDPHAWASACCFLCCLPCMLWYCRVSS